MKFWCRWWVGWGSPKILISPLDSTCLDFLEEVLSKFNLQNEDKWYSRPNKSYFFSNQHLAWHEQWLSSDDCFEKRRAIRTVFGLRQVDSCRGVFKTNRTFNDTSIFEILVTILILEYHVIKTQEIQVIFFPLSIEQLSFRRAWCLLGVNFILTI